MNKNALKTTFLYILEVQSGECELFIVHMKQNHKPQQFYPEKIFKIMSSLFVIGYLCADMSADNKNINDKTERGDRDG